MTKKTFKIDMHLHSYPISVCSQVMYKQLIDYKQAQGYDGGVLTNHCDPSYYPPSRHDKFMQSFVAEYKKAKAYADDKGFLLMLGLEVTLFEPWYAHWLVYGVTEEQLLSSPCYFALTQKELFEYCEKNNLLLVQAHPYRYGGKPISPNLVHGLEINCSSRDLPFTEKIVEVAKERGQFVTCGTDYHGTNSFFGGTYLPKNVQTSVDLARYLRETPQTHLFLEEKELKIPVEKKNF